MNSSPAAERANSARMVSPECIVICPKPGIRLTATLRPSGRHWQVSGRLDHSPSNRDGGAQGDLAATISEGGR